MTRSWAALPRKKINKSVEGVKEVIYGEIRGKKEDFILKKKKMWVAAENCVCVWLLHNVTTRAIRLELLSWYREILKNKYIKLGRRQLYKYSNARGKIRLSLTALVK